MSLKLGTTSAQIAADIQRVASEQSYSVDELPRSQYLKHGGIYSSRQIHQCGGWSLVKRTFFKEGRKAGEIRASQLVNAEVNRLRRTVGDTEYLGDLIAATLAKMPAVKLSYTPKPTRRPIARMLNLLLSDLHLGSDLTQAEHLRAYGPREEAAALWSVIKNVCEYKIEHRAETELAVNVLGDIIENELHGPAGSAPLHIQVCRAIYLLTQAIGLLAKSFPKVRVHFAVGNHGRDASIHPKRATHQKFNAIETGIYYAVKTSCRSLGNVTFEQPLTPWVDYHAQGHRIYATHGDTNLTPGNPGSSIATRSLQNQTNQINAALKDREEYRVFAVGHVHQAMVTQLPNGAYLITNGALVPPGGFAQSLNIMEAPQTQVIWETTQAHPVGDFRFITVDQNIKDSQIKAFEGLDDY